MQNENNKKTKYPLAKAGRRIGAKVIDIALISLIVIALGFIVFCTDPNFSWNSPLILAQNWRYGLFVTLMLVVFFGLLLALPVFWKKTIGMKAVGVSYYKTKETNILWALFKHELFVWEIVVIIAFIMGWTLTGLNDQTLIDSLFAGANAIFANAVPEGLNTACYYVGTGFSCFYGISILFLIAIIVAVCIRSGRPAFHDKYSSLVVFHKKQQEQFTPYTSKKKNQKEDIKVPGQLSADSLEEIDNI